MNDMPPRLLDASGQALTRYDERLPAPIESPASFLAMIERAARDPAVDVTKMSALLDVQERVLAKRAESEFNEAFAALAPKLPRIKKDGSVEYQGKKVFRFATWEAIDVGIRPLLAEHGFALSFDTAPANPGILITGRLMHVAGHARSASIVLPFDASGGKNALQAVASAFSYGKRYTGTMLLNIVTEGDDDDGVLGGMEFIDERCRQEINRLLTETKSDGKAFLAFMGVDSIAQIQVKDYARAINALMAKKQKRRE